MTHQQLTEGLGLYLFVLYIEMAIVFGLTSVLRSNDELNPIEQVIRYAISPLLLIYGVTLTAKRRKEYFKSLRDKLSI